MNDNNNNNSELQRHFAVAAERGRKRFKRRIKQLTLDQTRAGLEIISMNIDDVEQELKNQLQMRADSGGGPKAFWEKWLLHCDINWKQETGYDNKGNVIFNAPADTNLFSVADLSLRVVLEGYGQKKTLVRIVKRLGEAFYAHTFGVCLGHTRDGDRVKKQIAGTLMSDARDGKTTEEKALWIAAQRGHTPEAWGENQIMQCGAILWNAVAVGGKVFKHEKEIMDVKINFGDWTNKDFQMKETYKPVLRPEVQERMDATNAKLETMTPLIGPMPEPPLPWSNGGFSPYKDTHVYSLVKFVRNTGEDQQVTIDHNRKNNKMVNVEKAVDIVSRVPYEIDEYVFACFQWIKADEKRAALVNGFPHIEYIKPEIRDEHGKVLTKEQIDAMPRRERADARKEIKEIRADNDERKANLERLSQWEYSAWMHLDEQHNARGQFWMSHNCDFRGRVYHVGDFGHHNCDAVRALFKFARKKPIGNNTHWLMRALANNYGVDKVSLDKREAWAKANLEMIDACGRDFTDDETEIAYWEYDDSENLVEAGTSTPFNFWRVADKALQFVAAAHELANYGDWCLRNPDNANDFPSGLAISQDATNSGMQHYAAACRNYEDGLLTNLVPQDELNDLYTKCLNRAKVLFQEKLDTDTATYNANPITPDEQLEIDAHEAFQDDENNDYDDLKANRDDFKDTPAGQKLKTQRHIDVCNRVLNWDGYNRKVMKRNAMTFAYSSRRHGFAEQIWTDTMQPLGRKVRKREIPEHPFGRDGGFLAANIMAGIHEQAIKDTVVSANDGMAFLQSCAVALSRENKHFQFVSKWGFPMFQNYQHYEDRGNRPMLWLYNFGSLDYDKGKDAFTLRKFNGQVHARDSKQGIAPNVIHTQDALMLQAAVVQCDALGITDLMVIHDSFATVLADVDTMSGVLRMALASLYEDYDVWDDIRTQTIARLDDPQNIEAVLPAPDPSAGTLVLSQILKSKYAFS